MSISRCLSAAAAACLLAMTSPAAADTTATMADNLIPREVLFGNPEMAIPNLSPDGKWLAYVKPDEGVLNVWVRPTAGGEEKVITKDRKRGVRIYTWLPDSTTLLYMQDKDGDENYHIYRVSVEGGDAVDLTPYEGVRASIAATHPEITDRVLISHNKRDAKLFDILELNPHTGETTMVMENPGDVAGFSADHDMRVRVAEALLKDNSNEIRVHDGTTWSVFMTIGPDESGNGAIGFSPDNSKLLVSTSIDANAARLLEIDLKTSETRVIAGDEQFDVSGVMAHPRTHEIQSVVFVKERTDYEFFDDAVKADFEVLRKVSTGEIGVASRTLDDSKWIVAFDRDDGPFTYYMYDRATKKAEKLFSTRPKLEKYRLSPMEPVSFTARDGMKIYGYLTVPAGSDGKNLPTVINVHGGPWARDTWGMDNEVQWLANRGYAVMQVNFRGSTGYGKQYQNAGDRQWGSAMHDDIVDAKRWLVERGTADPKRVAVMGGSYGGYAALVAATFTPEEFTAAISCVGPSSLITLINSIPPYWEPVKALFEKRMGAAADEEFLKSRSPLFKAANIVRPLLVAQGANDPRVKQPESDQIVEAARKNGKEVTYLVFPDEGHGFARPENRRKYYAAVEQFLAEHLGGRAEPPAAEEKWDELLK